MKEMCCNCGHGKICSSCICPTDKCSHWTPNLEQEKPNPVKDAAQKYDELINADICKGKIIKAHESTILDFSTEREKLMATIKEQQETIEQLRKSLAYWITR